MAKVSFGSLSVFNHETQEWKLYKGRLEQWFLANEISEETDKAGVKRRAILLSSLAETTYRLATTLALPKEIGSLSYSDVTSLLDGHFEVKKCGFAERHNFFSAVQDTSESFSDWAARVRGFSMHCGFAASGLEESLRDRFVLGMTDGPERDRLFGEPMEGLTLAKAVQLAESVRCARKGAQQAAARAGSAAGAGAGAAPSYQLDVHKIAARAPARDARQPRPPETQDTKAKSQCSVCGYSNHDSKKCKFRNATCRKCGSKGHLVRVCSSKKADSRHYFLQCCSDDNDDDGKRLLFNIRCEQGKPLQESIVVGGIGLTFEIDTGSAVTAISETDYKNLFSAQALRKSNKILRSYNGSNINCLGTLTLPFSYKGRKENIEIFVIKNGGPPLLGRDFLSKFKLQICSIQSSNVLEPLLEQYSHLFTDTLGCCKDVQVKLQLKPDAIPIFHKARPVPFALRQKLEQELNRLQALGIIEPVSFSDFGSPIVPIIKKDGSIRLCADYSATLNKQLIVDKYPLPRIDELFAKLHGGMQFTKLDLSGAYNQLRLDPSSQPLTCINTHKGLYKYTRLVFGLSCAPAIFQRTLEKILAGVDGVLQFLDDILITGSSREEHLARLQEVFRRLENAGLVLKRDKCSFFEDSVTYLGFVIDKHGLHKSPEKVQAIINARHPSNVTELKSFLGLVNYYRTFIKNASTILYPLHKLLQKNVKWEWTHDQEKAFNDIKTSLASDNTLAHFDPDARIILTVDASPYGLGAILSQQDKDGVEKPVSYMSRSLNAAERKYSQIQKESTAIIFGVRKFHQFLYGRATPFILRTDHKPLLSIFRPGKGIPEVSANRLQRYALFLSAYNYTIEYVSSAHNTADFLSRSMALTSSVDQERGDGSIAAADDSDLATYVHFVVGTGSPPALLRDVTRATESDATLSQVMRYIKAGWPARVMNRQIKPYFNCRAELSVENGCIMRGSRLVIPETLITSIITELHRGHLGIAKMKAEARSRFWWPGQGARLERAAAACVVCMQLRPAPPRAPLTPWKFPSEAFFRVHLDFLGPLNNKMYLVAVDAYSKWVEVYDVSSGYGSKVVINALCEMMARFGLFHTICTDNGTSFVSSEFEDFCAINGITHITTPTYHPASNGQAESYVKIIKKALKGIILSGTQKSNLNLKLNEFLFYYRNSIHSTTNRSPAEILFGRRLRCRLDLLKPPSQASDTALTDTVNKNQCSQVTQYRGNRNIEFKIGDQVLVKIHVGQNVSWSKGLIKKKLGKSAYLVILDGTQKTIKRHKNQLYVFKGESGIIDNVSSRTQSHLNQLPSSSETKTAELLPPVILSTAGSTLPPAPIHTTDGAPQAPPTASTSAEPAAAPSSPGEPGPDPPVQSTSSLEEPALERPALLPSTVSAATPSEVPVSADNVEAPTTEGEIWADCNEAPQGASTGKSSTSDHTVANPAPSNVEAEAKSKRPRKPVNYKQFY